MGRVVGHINIDFETDVELSEEQIDKLNLLLSDKFVKHAEILLDDLLLDENLGFEIDSPVFLYADEIDYERYDED